MSTREEIVGERRISGIQDRYCSKVEVSRYSVAYGLAKSSLGKGTSEV